MGPEGRVKAGTYPGQPAAPRKEGGRGGGTHLILAKLAEKGVGPGEQGLAGLWVLQRQALGKG